MWTAHRRDKSKETTQHCTEWLKQNTKELDLRAGKRTNLRRGRFSGGEKSPEKARSAGKTEQAIETGKMCFFLLSRILQCHSGRQKEKPFTFCLNGRQEQGRTQGGQRCGKPGPHARPQCSQPHEDLQEEAVTASEQGLDRPGTKLELEPGHSPEPCQICLNNHRAQTGT